MHGYTATPTGMHTRKISASGAEDALECCMHYQHQLMSTMHADADRIQNVLHDVPEEHEPFDLGHDYMHATHASEDDMHTVPGNGDATHVVKASQTVTSPQNDEMDAMKTGGNTKSGIRGWDVTGQDTETAKTNPQDKAASTVGTAGGVNEDNWQYSNKTIVETKFVDTSTDVRDVDNNFAFSGRNENESEEWRTTDSLGAKEDEQEKREGVRERDVVFEEAVELYKNLPFFIKEPVSECAPTASFLAHVLKLQALFCCALSRG
jgi:hypothetical protein